MKQGSGKGKPSGKDLKVIPRKSNRSSNIKRRIKAKQRVFLSAFEKYQGIITGACKETGINRATYYRWMKKFPDFRARANRILKHQVDYVEDRLLKAIAEDNIAAIIFYLKCKHPMYKPRQEISFDYETLDRIEKILKQLAKQ